MGEMSLDFPWYQPQSEDLIRCAELPGVFLPGSSPCWCCESAHLPSQQVCVTEEDRPRFWSIFCEMKFESQLPGSVLHHDLPEVASCSPNSVECELQNVIYLQVHLYIVVQKEP